MSQLRCFLQGLQYQIDYATSECRRTHITGFSYHEEGVEANATFTGSMYVGSAAVTEVMSSPRPPPVLLRSCLSRPWPVHTGAPLGSLRLPGSHGLSCRG